MHWWVADGQDVAGALDAAVAAVACARSGSLPNQKGGRRKGHFSYRAEDGKAYLLKSNRYAGSAAWRRRISGSKARVELHRAEAVSARGIPTPTPVAVGEERSRGLLVQCWNLVPRLPEVCDLRAGVCDGGLSAGERRAMAAPFGAFVARLHQAGIDQDDFSPNNFLVRPGSPPEFWMIDFERTRIGSPPTETRRANNLAKLIRELPQTQRTERWRFLRGFAPEHETFWWARIESAARDRAAVDFRRLRRTCLGEGRRFHKDRGRDWSGHFRDIAARPPCPADLDADATPRFDDELLYIPLGPDGRALHWVVANLLFLRQLALEPVAFWRGRNGACLAYRLEPGVRLPSAVAAADERVALRKLELQLGAIAELRDDALPGPRSVLARGADRQLRALRLDPRGIEPGGKVRR